MKSINETTLALGSIQRVKLCHPEVPRFGVMPFSRCVKVECAVAGKQMERYLTS